MNQAKNNHFAVTVVIHLIFIVLTCFLPDLLHHYSHSNDLWVLSSWGLARSCLLVIVFYINYLVIIPQLLLKRRQWVLFILVNVAICAVDAALMRYIGHLEFSQQAFDGFRSRRPFTTLPAIDLLSFVLRDFVTQILVTALAVALRLSSTWYDLQQKHQQALVASRDSELAGLRQQLNPHFLFNTLNSIYALIDISPDKAQHAVHSLSHMLRYMVYENPEKVELEREIDFIDTFVDLMRLRMPDRPIIYTVDNQAPNATIAPLVFITQVENAFKHGNTSNHSEPITITITATDRVIDCSTSNGIDPNAHHDQGHGVGLTNLRRRLELIYGKNAAITTECHNHQYLTHLTIFLQ